MKRVLGLSLLIAMTGTANLPAQDATLPAQTDPARKLNTVRDKASYAIGHAIGRNLKAQGLEVDPKLLAQGLADELAGNKGPLSNAELQQAIRLFEKQMGEKLTQRRRDQGAINQQEGQKFLAANKKKPGVVTLPSGLQYKVIKRGNGATPTKTDTVKTHYHGTLLNGKVFDSSVERGEPISFPVGGVIAGWTEALQLMKVGDKWQLFIPSNLAYAERGAGEDIGPHAVLIFEIELLGVGE